MAKPIEVVLKAERKLFIGPCEGCEHKSSVVLLHGWGDNAAGWYDSAMWMATKLQNTRFVIPSAPLHGGDRSWWELKKDTCWDATGYVLGLVKEEKKVVSEVALMGFSQGGNLSLATMMQEQEHIAAVVCLSSFVSTRTQLPPPFRPDVPVMLAHGDQDRLVPVSSMSHSVKKLNALHYTNIVTKVYEGMAHSACGEELQDIVDFLSSSFQPQAKL